MIKMINVYDSDGIVIARVKDSNNLDRGDDRNCSSGFIGEHSGITRLKDGRFVLIHTTPWEGKQNWGEIISRREAIQEIFKGEVVDPDELLSKYGLQKEAKEMLIAEAEEAEEVVISETTSTATLAGEEMPSQVEPSLEKIETFEVPSERGNVIYYIVKHNTETNQWGCSCPDFLFRGRDCKHIIEVRGFQRLKGDLEGC